MLVGGAHSWKYDFLNAFADFPKHKWVRFSRGTGRDEGYYSERYNEELFESALNCYHLRCMENACYTLHELGRTLPDGLVLIQNGLEPPEDEVLATLRMARRAGISRLCVFLDWYEEMLRDPDFARVERQQAERLRRILGEIGFDGDVPITSGDSSRLLDPPDMRKRPGGNGTDPGAIYAGRVRSGAKSGVGRHGAAVLEMLDGQYPERPEDPPPFLRLAGLEKTASPKRIRAGFALEAGVVRAGEAYYLALPGSEAVPVRINRLFNNGYSYEFGLEKREMDAAFYDGRYHPTQYAALLSLPGPWAGEPPAAAWLAKRPGELREKRELRALIACPEYGGMPPGAAPREDEAAEVLVRTEGEDVRGRAVFLPAGANGLAAGVREAHIALDRPLCLPHQARIALPAGGGAGGRQAGWWHGVAADV